MTEANRELVRHVFDAWSRADIGPLLAAMADECRWVFAGSWSWSGVWSPKRAVVDGLFRGHLAPQFREPYSSHPQLILADGDRVVVQTRGQTTTVRGEPYENTYCLIFRLHDLEIVEVVEHCDTALVERALEPPQADEAGWTRTTSAA